MECMLSNKMNKLMIGQMAIAIALPGFNDLRCSVTPIFLLIDCFLYQFSKFSEKYEENLLIRSYFFLQKYLCTIEFCSFYSSSSFICAAVSNAS